MESAGAFEELVEGIYLNTGIVYNMPGDWKNEILILDKDFESSRRNVLGGFLLNRLLLAILLGTLSSEARTQFVLRSKPRSFPVLALNEKLSINTAVSYIRSEGGCLRTGGLLCLG